MRLVPQVPSPRASTRRPAPARRAPTPPVGVPPRARLAAQARAQLAEAVRLAHWAHRAGRSPEADGGRQAAADLGLTVSQVREHFSRARLAGLVEYDVEAGEGATEPADAGAVRAGWRLRAWERDDSAALRGWVALFDAWSLARPAPSDADPGAVADVVAAVPQLLSVMRLSDGPVTAAGLVGLLRQRIGELRAERPREARQPLAPGLEAPASGAAGEPAPSAGPAKPAEPAPLAESAELAESAGQGAIGPRRPAAAREAAPRDPEAGAGGTAGAETDEAELVRLLGWALDALAAVGALTLHARSAHPVRARLTELGGWAVWTKLEHICIAAQSPAGNIEQSAVDMLRGCATLTPGPARAEYRAWLAARTTEPAVAELLDAARGEDALIRGLAFEALRVVGAPARSAVRAVADEPLLRPYALLWLAEHDEGDPRADPEDSLAVLSREEATWLWVDTASAAQEHGAERALLDHLDSAHQPSVAELVDDIRACGHPRTVQVLLGLAAAHPDPALAKRIRRAAFQVHTGGS
ncbi:hypothetical protein [Streptomyces sp. 4N509B]|uniref:hypothetical protein n=1 Tax=Streptomyces sp. 4N509B TaxID=3457413 RepID=UPI003FCF53D1